MKFPEDFLWGVATSSYQIEGASLEDNRGECIWHRFSHTPDHVFNDDNGDVACDHYHRYPEDVALMQSLGVHGYRFSVSWPRVLPQGIGAANPLGLDFYDRVVDELLKANITPYLTLYHWDLPQALQDKGGWANPSVVDWFLEYTSVMTSRLGDRVKHWATHNEPWVVAFLGHQIGLHAPGIQDLPTALKVSHHLMVSHGKAVPLIRSTVADAQVGIVIDQVYIEAASENEADKQAARLEDSLRNLWFLDPVFKGAYPADALAHYGAAMDGIDLDEVKVAAAPIDYLGMNYYARNLYSANGSVPPPPDAPVTAMGWEVYPRGLYNLLVRANECYSPKAVYITENGAAYEDPAPENGVIEDPERQRYLELHFEQTALAIEAGVPVKGYFVWSFLDNFEWAYGYSQRFGIIHVDFETLQRTPKRSALYLKDLIAGQ
ncbi:MAG: beta-glucosidase [Anaerolineales bacterium]|nr:beta-glucosidase [Anaerolineales bacterium]